jgi:hypothetical protein
MPPADDMSGSPLGAVPIEVDDLVAMRRALRHLVQASPMSTATLERLAGLPAGYISKVLNERPLRGLTGNTIFLLTAVLGRKVVLIADPAAEARVKAHHAYVVCTVNQRRFGQRDAEGLRILARLAKETGKIGGLACMKKMTPLQRSRSARRAAKARWDKHRRRLREARRAPSVEAVPPPA